MVTLSWLLMGLVADPLGKLLMPGKDPGGWIVTILLGIVGAFVSGWLGSLVGFGSMDGFNIGSILTATAAAVILLFLYRVLARVGPGFIEKHLKSNLSGIVNTKSRV